jgi:predicted transposase/invertase (TIGR01784 family)
MEEEELMEEIKQLDPQESEQIFKLPNSWREKGRAEGIQKGIQKEKRQTALEMLREGLSVELISKVTKLSHNEIEELRGNV